MKNITVAALRSRLDAGEDLIILDVREQAEFDEVNMNGHLIPLSKLRQFEMDSIEQFKDREVIVHCKGGVRSIEACMLLEQNGFTNTVNLEGGIMAWLNN